MHHAVMRTHAQIVNEAGVDAVAADRNVSIHTVRSWKQRNSIPAEHWNGFVRNQWAAFEELAKAAEQRLERAA